MHLCSIKARKYLSITRIHRSQEDRSSKVKQFNLLIHYFSLMTMHHSSRLTNIRSTLFHRNWICIHVSLSSSGSLIGSFACLSLTCIMSHLRMINSPLKVVSSHDSRIFYTIHGGRRVTCTPLKKFFSLFSPFNIKSSVC